MKGINPLNLSIDISQPDPSDGCSIFLPQRAEDADDFLTVIRIGDIERIEKAQGMKIIVRCENPFDLNQKGTFICVLDKQEPFQDKEVAFVVYESYECPLLEDKIKGHAKWELQMNDIGQLVRCIDIKEYPGHSVMTRVYGIPDETKSESTSSEELVDLREYMWQEYKNKALLLECEKEELELEIKEQEELIEELQDQIEYLKDENDKLKIENAALKEQCQRRGNSKKVNEMINLREAVITIRGILSIPNLPEEERRQHQNTQRKMMRRIQQLEKEEDSQVFTKAHHNVIEPVDQIFVYRYKKDNQWKYYVTVTEGYKPRECEKYEFELYFRAQYAGSMQIKKEIMRKQCTNVTQQEGGKKKGLLKFGHVNNIDMLMELLTKHYEPVCILVDKRNENQN